MKINVNIWYSFLRKPSSILLRIIKKYHVSSEEANMLESTLVIWKICVHFLMFFFEAKFEECIACKFSFDLNLFFLTCILWKWGQKYIKLFLVKHFPVLSVCFILLCIHWMYIFSFPTILFFLRNLAQFRKTTWLFIYFFVLRGILLYKFIIVGCFFPRKHCWLIISICDKLILSWSN